MTRELIITIILPFITGIAIGLLPWKYLLYRGNKAGTVIVKYHPSMYACRRCLKTSTVCQSSTCGFKAQRCLLNTLSSAKHTIDICVCLITENNILKTLTYLANNGIRIRVIIDHNLFNQGGKGGNIVRKALIDAHISVVEISPGIMHHKFAIVDRNKLIDGSMNWTVSSTFGNYENLLVTTSTTAIDAFQNAFDEIWDRFQNKKS